MLYIDRMHWFYILSSFLSVANCQSLLATTYTLHNASQATELTGIFSSTISGSLAIATGFLGPVDLGSIEAIHGDLRCDGADGITKISASSLFYINGTMSLDNMAGLTSLSFRELTSVGGISWNRLPALSEATSRKSITHAPSIRVTGTRLSNVNLLNPSSLDVLYIYDNPLLDSISFPSSISLAATDVSISGGLPRDGRPPLSVDLGKVSNASFVTLNADFGTIKGFESLENVTFFQLYTSSNFDCSQFSSFKYGDVGCFSSNSSYRVVKYLNGTTLEFTKRNTYESLISSTKLWIGLMVSLPITLILFFAFMRFMDLRQTKKEPVNTHPGIPELALGGHHEKTELAVFERPGELTEIPDIVHELPNSMSANIIDVREMEIQPVREVEEVAVTKRN